MDTVNWGGYEFDVHTKNTKWNDVPGLYIFTGLNQRNRWVALYIGETDSLAERIPGHEHWTEAVQLGATHIHARAEQEENHRVLVEATLVSQYKPRLNVQYK